MFRLFEWANISASVTKYDGRKQCALLSDQGYFANKYIVEFETARGIRPAGPNAVV